MRRLGLLLSFALVAGVMGCGEGGAEGFPPTSSSKAELLVQANTACRHARDSSKAEIKQYLKLHSHDLEPLAVRNAELAHFMLLPAVELEIDRVYALKGYARYQRSLDEGLGLERLAIDDIANRRRLPSLAAFAQRFAEAARMLRASGLSVCAAGPATIARYAEPAA